MGTFENIFPYSKRTFVSDEQRDGRSMALRIGRNVPVVSDLPRAPDFNVRAQSR